jgi:hypothetical protein
MKIHFISMSSMMMGYQQQGEKHPRIPLFFPFHGNVHDECSSFQFSYFSTGIEPGHLPSFVHCDHFWCLSKLCAEAVSRRIVGFILQQCNAYS